MNARRDQDLQYQLGFGRIPKKITMPSGRVIAHTEATITGLRSLATQLRKRKDSALDEVERAISVMAAYTGKGRGKKQRITWGEVLELEAEKAKKAGK